MNLQQLPAVIKQQIPTARLPINYEAAKKALAECMHVDECKEWADRAVALASYARQLRDNSLKEAAVRIQLRASARIGELLLAIPRKECGMRGPSQNRLGALKDPTSRTQVAVGAGLSSATAYHARCIAYIPKEEREALIEASPPPSQRELAAVGKPLVPAYHNSRPGFVGGAAYRIATGHEGVSRFASWTKRNPAAPLARQMAKDEAKFIRVYLRQIEEWLDDFERHLPKTEAAAVS